MTIKNQASGTQTATGGGVEDFLTSPNVVGKFRLYIDTVNMVAGDVLEVRVYKMVLTGGTQRVHYFQRYEGAQQTDDLIKASLEIWNDLTDSNAVRFSITQKGGGTDKNFPWVVLREDNEVGSFVAGAITAAAIATDAIDADALAADAVTEIWAKAMSDLAAVPGATASVLSGINWLFELSRNRMTQNSTTGSLYKDDGTTVLATTTVADNGTTFDRGEFA